MVVRKEHKPVLRDSALVEALTLLDTHQRIEIVAHHPRWIQMVRRRDQVARVARMWPVRRASPRLDRTLRLDVHRHPHYYAVRNHIVDFLVSRSKSFAAETPGHDPRDVPVVRVGKPELTIALGDEELRQASRAGLSRPSASC